MENKKMNKNNSKKMITGIMIGAVALSAPFAVMAAPGSDIGKMGNNNLDNLNGGSNYNDMAAEKMDLLKETLQLQIEHANSLIDDIDVDDNVDVDELRNIVDEFALLEASIDELNIDGALADDMRSLYFEIKGESRDLSSEFKGLIETAFSEEERDVLREELQVEKQVLKQNYNLGFKNSDNAMKGSMSNEYDSLTDEERDAICTEMRWTNTESSANGDGVKQGTGKGAGGKGAGAGQSNGQRLMSN